VFTAPMSIPAAIVLDVNETLIDLTGLLPVFTEFGMGQPEFSLWFARTLREGFGLSAAGDYRTFAEVATAALLSLQPGRLTDADAALLLQGFKELKPHPDVPEGLAILASTGLPICTLSVGNPAVVESIFTSSGLSEFVSMHLSVDAVQRWKPAREPYEFACAQLDTSPHNTMMIAAHSWDLNGARLAGMQTAWISRLEKIRPAIYPPADIEGPDLITVARRLQEITTK